MAAWRSLDPDIHLVDSTRARHMRTPPEPRARRMAELGIDAINLHESDWSPEWIETFQRHRRRCFAWDAQEDATLARCVAWRLDGLFSDHVDRMMRAIGAAD